VHGVSILVVLDQGRRPGGASSGARNLGGFNPCCPGSGSATICLTALAAAPSVFQSLLSWIRVGDTPRLTRAYGFTAVSIHVVLDHGRLLLVAIHPTSLLVPDVSILVVLDQGRRRGGPTLPSGSLRSFNPCCPGSGSATVLHTLGV